MILLVVGAGKSCEGPIICCHVYKVESKAKLAWQCYCNGPQFKKIGLICRLYIIGVFFLWNHGQNCLLIFKTCSLPQLTKFNPSMFVLQKIFFRKMRFVIIIQIYQKNIFFYKINYFSYAFFFNEGIELIIKNTQFIKCQV